MNGVRSTRSSITVSQHIFVLCLFVLFLFIMPMQPAFGQNFDTVGPVIELEELTVGEAAQTQVFTVLIAEDVLLRDAALYYRREGQLPFTPAPMQALGDTGYYSVSIPTDSTDLRTIEYYVQARDEAGNRTVSGFAFDPYQRRLQPSSKITTNTESQTTVEPIPTSKEEANIPPILRQRWVQVALGVVAVGIVASLASSSGGSDSEVVPLTFNLE